jgi:hypothetical protein
MTRSKEPRRDKQLIRPVTWLLFIAIVTFAFFPQIKGILLAQSETQTEIALAKRSVFDHYASSNLDDR